ncbi:MAG TPA: flavodoxin family protein [Armatimonadota bacterium]|jgi:multimeric flavodoxin WrbA
MTEQKKPLIVAVAGSPRRGGNTDTLLEAAALGASEEGAQIEWMRPNEMQFVACQHCGGCTATGVCVIQDDMQSVYDLIERMDGMLLASPIYFASVTGQVKSMIDRAQALWARKYLLNKPISDDGKDRTLLFLAVLGGRSRGQIRATRLVVESFVDTFDGQYGELIFPQIEAPGEIADHWTALPQAHAAGAALAAHLRQ